MQPPCRKPRFCTENSICNMLHFFHDIGIRRNCKVIFGRSRQRNSFDYGWNEKNSYRFSYFFPIHKTSDF